MDETVGTIAIAGDGYGLRVSRREPAIELALNGRAIATLRAGSGVDATDALDERTRLGPPELRYEPDGAAVVRWRGGSDRWASKEVELRAWAGGFGYGYTIEGRGDLDRAHFFRTRSTPSPARGVRLFTPEPNSGCVRYTGQRCPPGKRCALCYPEAYPDAVEYAGRPDFMTVGVGRDRLFHDGNWFFTPAPFCFAVEGGGNWLGVGVAAEPGAWTFTDYHYPADGFGFSLVYDGHTAVNGVWRSPTLLCLTAPDEYAAIARYCDELRAGGLVPAHGRDPARDWWREPIFCGWGEQISREVHCGPPRAPDRSTQGNYERWLRALETHGLDPGTVVIDDKWQGSYGLNDVEAARWPDLAGFVAGQHARGRRVLLWLKAWDPEGLPPDECVVDATGLPVAADPGAPAYARRLAEQVRHMLRDLDADGFKIDFTHLIPTGPRLGESATQRYGDAESGRPAVSPSAGGRWGLELLRQWLAIVSDAARAAKPDALIIAHTANPYLADLVDMLRLNDVAGLADPCASIVPDMRYRARVARAASPHWLLDADNWPCASRAQWRDYVRAQASGELGVPSLYHAERLGWGPTDEPLQEEDYAAVRETWATYRAHLRPETPLPPPAARTERER